MIVDLLNISVQDTEHQNICQMIKQKNNSFLISDYYIRVNEPEQEETDQRVMTLFPALNLEALRVAADTLVPKFIPVIPKIVTKITSEVKQYEQYIQFIKCINFKILIYLQL
ncbi:Hypothetical_protein [Hexamita inflata]|uniref:Hypothetical_protein n=1 Tax=Hexamita inflata TaxID=28002 RepID=A0AA86U3Z1_9EUKA|nr:Hypothetical protein HINF_LOCUS17628 [Hexamita inflata]